MNEHDLSKFLAEFRYYLEKRDEKTYVIRDFEFDSIILSGNIPDETNQVQVLIFFTQWLMNQKYDEGYDQGKRTIQTQMKKLIGIRND